MLENFQQKLETLLKKDGRLLDKQGGLLKVKAVDLALKNDNDLLKLLLSEPAIKDRFFEKIGAVLVFKQGEFADYLSDKNFLANSYTKYKNKIGLNIDNKFLNERGEVALVWPFKDCVLEGGATRDEEKRRERFFNAILAQDEIDQLFSPKVLTNWKRYGQAKTEFQDFKKLGFKEQENLIIKGNNLLALHSLKQRFQGKIKLIYIDPPYNTGNDSFNYNDNFNHSTWLTFMKNRLEVARDLLRDDGSIYVQLDYNEIHYCKVLMDEIFGRENFKREIAVSTGWPLGFKASTNNWIKVHDTILFYSKSKNYDFKKLYRDYEVDYEKRAKKDKDGRLWVDQSLGNISVEKLEEFKIEGIAYQTKTGNWRKKQYLDEMKGELITDFWKDILPINSQSKEKQDITGQKSEELIKRIIESCTNNDDIVLDFFMGSGTTCAVAHKMGRQYIGIEQMDYGKNDAIVRLQNVIKGDQSGISKAVGWKSGGGFVYCELMKYNEMFVEQINKVKTTAELLKIWQAMQAKSFLNFDTPIEKINQTLSIFKKLPLASQRQFLFDLLNKNQLYMPLSSIDDADFKVSPTDKTLNQMFYK